ncbi:YceI family protein [Mariniflexile ostreae]|uniref:YceI family protein n=1 Tax=Mariniflexile ostreae TaxID=1520892 RepID=A0ABV5FAB6_9FLAO
MLKLKKMNRIMLKVFALFLLTSSIGQAQEFNLNNQESSLKVLGTSNVHDWELEAENLRGKISFKNLNECIIEACNIEVTVEGLKSGKSSMDKNTFKALKSEKHKTISFKLVEVKTVENKDAGKFSVQSVGDLTIAGVKKRVDLNFILNHTEGKVNLTGEKKIKMTDFNVDPPKAMFGAITTGDEVLIKFSTQLK